MIAGVRQIRERRNALMSVYVPDVGDGLAAGIRTLDGTRIEIDCGSQHEEAAAFHIVF